MTCITEFRGYRELLKYEFKKRSESKAGYSLRSFARDLGISSSRLSEIFNEKKGLSRSAAKAIAERLSYTAPDTEYFCDLVEAEDARSGVMREIAKQKIETHIESRKTKTETATLSIGADQVEAVRGAILKFFDQLRQEFSSGAQRYSLSVKILRLDD